MGGIKAFRLVACLLGLLMPGLAVAADDARPPPQPSVSPTLIVVVDANRVQRECLAGKGVVAERDRYQQSFNAQFEATRKQLQAAEQDLARQRPGLAADVFQDKARSLNNRVAEFQREYQSAVRALDKSSAMAGNELQKALISVTSQVASEMGAGLVLHKQQVFLHDERMDITNVVIERLNKRLTAITFPAPDVKMPAPVTDGEAREKK